MAFGIEQALFGNMQWGVYGFLSLIPLIIIYLIRPRPQQIEIPSLMFFLTTHDNPRQHSFLRRISKDWLFLLHLLLLCLLALNLMEPYHKYQHDVTSQNTVIVLDVSASSKTMEGAKSRFQIGVDAAIQALGSSNTLILAKNTPTIFIRDAISQDAASALNQLRPSDTPSAIGDAMILAGETLANREGRVVVISDFINTDGIEPNTARAALVGQNKVVDMIDTASATHKRNIAITNIDLDEETTTVFVHNYEKEPQDIKLHIGDSTKSITIPALGTDTYSFKTSQKVTKITMDNSDDLDADDIAYISAPEKKPIKIQLITNNASIFLSNALKSLSEAQIDVTAPPIVPKGDYDVYVIHDIISKNVLPGTYEEILNKVKNGKAAVVAASPGYLGIDFKGILPVNLKGTSNRTATNIEQVNSFTKNIDFGGMDQYYNATPILGAITILSDGKNNSIITYQQYGAGKLVWYGIQEKQSDFKVHPNYPIFWSKLLGFLVNEESIKNLNMRTGETLILEDMMTVKTPSKVVQTSAMLLDEAGVYDVNGRKIVANLLNEKESAINPEKILGESAAKPIELKPVSEEREFNWELPLIAIAGAFLFLELAYIKIRGDL